MTTLNEFKHMNDMVVGCRRLTVRCTLSSLGNTKDNSSMSSGAFITVVTFPLFTAMQSDSLVEFRLNTNWCSETRQHFFSHSNWFKYLLIVTKYLNYWNILRLEAKWINALLCLINCCCCCCCNIRNCIACVICVLWLDWNFSPLLVCASSFRMCIVRN